jgi:glycerol-3-phosphate dehydrogenase
MEAFMQRDFSALSKSPFDLAIIGGGATGAAIALDASLRGLRVALIDKGDFAAATSAGSSKLMHGGLRYLANGDIRQVREGLRERRHWSRIAKHLVHPLGFIIPTYEDRKPRRSLLKIGLYLYDLLAFDRNRSVDPMQKIAGHRSVTAAQVLGLSPDTPHVGAQGTLTGGLMYQDGQMLSPERLVLAILRTAVQAGAVVVNHCEATDLIKSGKRISGVNIKDNLSQARAALSAKLVVNAAGPWADDVMKLAGNQKQTKKLIRSKGIHLVTRSLTRGIALTVPVADEHVFILPWMGMSLLATTDTKFDEDPDAACVTEADIHLLLNKTNAVLPEAQLTRDDVVHAYVGLRPLVADIDDRAETTYGLSRGSEIYDHSEHGGPEGLLSALGGKWTAWRKNSRYGLCQIGPTRQTPAQCQYDIGLCATRRLGRFYGCHADAISQNRNRPNRFIIAPLRRLAAANARQQHPRAGKTQRPHFGRARQFRRASRNGHAAERRGDAPPHRRPDRRPVERPNKCHRCLYGQKIRLVRGRAEKTKS